MAKVCETLIKISPPVFCQWPPFVNINNNQNIIALWVGISLETSAKTKTGGSQRASFFRAKFLVGNQQTCFATSFYVWWKNKRASQRVFTFGFLPNGIRNQNNVVKKSKLGLKRDLRLEELLKLHNRSNYGLKLNRPSGSTFAHTFARTRPLVASRLTSRPLRLFFEHVV